MKTATQPVVTEVAPVPVPILPERNKKLAARMEKFNVELPPFAPVYDRIFVVPFEDSDLPDKTASGIVIPKVLHDKVNGLRGLLVAAGPVATEQLYAHGIAVGDIVLVARFSVWIQTYLGPKTGAPCGVMVLRASEVVGSLGLMNAYNSGDAWQEMDPATGKVQMATRDGERERNDPPENDEGV